MSSGERKTSSDPAEAGATIGPDALGTCPLPRSQYDHVVLGHGGGGRLSADLIERLFVPTFGGDVLARLEDQATVRLGHGNGVNAPRLAFTTDAFVVKPLFFPGGDIGKLAVCGTVNDLARIVRSMRAACDEAGVALVTGDTKVVDKGKGDEVFITTSGIGLVPEGRSLSIRNARPGDCVLISGTVGD